MASNHSASKTGSKVRVVAKIRGFSGPETNSEPDALRTVEWISVNRENSEDVTIAFGDESSSRYLVDYCYKEHEDNEMIYTREVKPLVSAAFEGHNSTVIALGARGSGKTSIIQGSAERPGLTVLAMVEFLSLAEINGKSIAISFYEVDHQEHAVDLLNPEQPPILIFEDRGRIQFKGLSRVPVKSIAEFQNLYLHACSASKVAPRKGGYERRSHKGLIVHVLSDRGSVEGVVSKMNIVDLAAYEDVRKKSSDGSCLAEINKINKSIYALLNVCHALSTNESRVPYRESKLTRMLQDSLRGTSKICLVSCLNPSFCQDTIYMVSLASRSCRCAHQTSLDAVKKSGITARQMVNSHKNQLPKTGTAKKLHSSKLLEKKAAVATKSAIKGRKLLDEVCHSASKAKKGISTAYAIQASEPSVDNSLSEVGSYVEFNCEVEKGISTAYAIQASEPSVDNSLSEVGSYVELNCEVEKDDLSSKVSNEVELNPLVEKDIFVDREDYQEKHIHDDASDHSKALSIITQEDHGTNKDNNKSITNGDESPPISSQLRDLSNSLKLLCSSTPSCKQLPEKELTSPNNHMSADITEPKTPVIEQNSVNNKWDVMNTKSPWEAFSMRRSGMKSSLVQEYLKLLNTADKEELKKLKGIGEKRATYILELREESPEPFKSLDNLKDIGLSAKQIKEMMKKEVGGLFS